MSIYDRLYKKMEAELNRFKDELKTKNPNEIIDKAYELTFKTEILVFFEADGFLDEQDTLSLLAQQEPLEELYNGWINTDSSYLDHLRDSVTDTVSELPPLPEHDVSVDTLENSELHRHKDVGMESNPGKPAEKLADKAKSKTLAEKIQAANVKVKSQDEPNANTKSRKREERD